MLQKIFHILSRGRVIASSALECLSLPSFLIGKSGEGVIASVEVAEGQAVAHGDVLFTFE